MKQIFLLVSLFITVQVNAQLKDLRASKIEVNDSLKIGQGAKGFFKIYSGGSANINMSGDNGIQVLNSPANSDSSTTVPNTGWVKRNIINPVPGWSIRGNSINPATDFIGTVSNNSFRIRTNNVQRVLVDSIGHVHIGSPYLNSSSFLDVRGPSNFGGDVNIAGNLIFQNLGGLGLRMATIDNSGYLSAQPIPTSVINNGTLGTLYSKNNWSSLSDFYYPGLTPTIIGGNIQTTGGNLTNPQPLVVNSNHCLEYWKVYTVSHQTGSTNSSSYGIAPASYSTAANYPTPIMAYVDRSNGPNSGKLILISTVAGSDKTAQSSNTITFTATDQIDVSLERAGNRFYATARNRTTNGNPIFANMDYICQNIGSAPFNLPNTGMLGIDQLGGTNILDSLSITSNVVTNPDLLYLMDSKGVGYNGGCYVSLASLSRAVFNNVVNMSGGGNRTVDMYNLKDDWKTVHSKYMILEAGSNDGTDSASVKLYYQKIVDTAHAYGFSVIHLAPLYHSVSSMTWRYNWIMRTYPVDSIIDAYEFTKYHGALSYDSLHLTAYGDSLVFQAIMASGKLTKGARSVNEQIINRLVPTGQGDPIALTWQNTKINDLQGRNYITFASPGGATSYADATDPTGNSKLTWDQGNQFMRLYGPDGHQFVITPSTSIVTNDFSASSYHIGNGQGGPEYITGGENFGDSALTFYPYPASPFMMRFTPAGGLSLGSHTAPVQSAALTINSTVKGFLNARLTTSQRNAIPSPATGLLIFNLTTNQNEFYNGSAWLAVGGITGGTNNYLTKWNSSSSVTTSLMYDDGNAVGIGTTTPYAHAVLDLQTGIAPAGFLKPRMTYGNRILLTGVPAIEVFNTSNGHTEVYNGSAWAKVANWSYIEISSTYSALLTDNTINCTTGTFTLTLPATDANTLGKVFIIKNSGGGTVTVHCDQGIDPAIGATDYVLSGTSRTKYVQVQSTISGYIVIGNN